MANPESIERETMARAAMEAMQVERDQLPDWLRPEKQLESQNPTVILPKLPADGGGLYSLDYQ